MDVYIATAKGQPRVEERQEFLSMENFLEAVKRQELERLDQLEAELLAARQAKPKRRLRPDFHGFTLIIGGRRD